MLNNENNKPPEEKYLNVTTVLYLLWFFAVNWLWDLVWNILKLWITSDKILWVRSESLIQWIQYICFPIIWAFLLLRIQELIEENNVYLESRKSWVKTIIILMSSVIVLWIAIFVMTNDNQYKKADFSQSTWPEILQQE